MLGDYLKIEFMNARLSWNQIIQTFPDQWVELVDYDWDLTNPTPESGVVKTHSADRQVFNALILQNPSTDSAIIYTGRTKLPANTFLHSNLRVAAK